ncbi:MAG: Rdx family protein [Calditrichaeota bacterium]|nr:Rdx family protein [Calditrichota bacterium]MCB0267451.1 Rdx family protein [Calditrichota bacterium]MCB0287060.1 Rdx family protein [Calditrichota bacterium]MCB9068526.1 SelT/SelW/SelH family protein [Calditrichia bacterium]
MAATLKNAVGIEALLIESSGGVFEVKVGDRLIFSKKREKRFPMHEEILEMLKNNR